MKHLFLIIIMILLSGGISEAQNQATTEKLNQIQIQINNVEKQIKSNPCYSKTGASKFCDVTDNNKFQALQLQKSQLEKDKKSEESKLIANSRRSQEKTESTEVIGLLLYLLVIVILGGIPLLVIIWLILKSPKTKSFSDAHGSAGWASDEELSEKGFIQNEVDSGNLVIGNQDDNNLVVLPTEINFRHTAVLGPPGTGKSRFFFMPNLYYLRDKASMFVHDTKGELYDATAGHWKNAIRLAPYDPDNSIPFNWIPYCTEENSLLTLDLAETIITNGKASKSSDSFWEDTEIALLAGMFSHVATTDCPTPAYVYDIITTLNLDQLISLMRNSKSKFANEQANLVEDAPDRVKQAILTGVRRTLTWLRDEKVRRFTSATTEKADLNILRTKKVAVYWCLPQTYGERLRPLTCLALKLLMFQLRQTKGENVYLLLDEFDALGRIPRFESDLALLRSEKVAIVVGIQSISQLAQNYGKDTAQVIFDNLQTKITLHALEYETAERISKNLGEFTLVENSVSTSSSFMDAPSTTIAERKHARKLMTADEIRRLDESLALTVTSNIKPFIKSKILFNSDISSTAVNICGSTKTRPVTRENTDKKNSDPMPEFPDLIGDL